MSEEKDLSAADQFLLKATKASLEDIRLAQSTPEEILSDRVNDALTELIKIGMWPSVSAPHPYRESASIMFIRALLTLHHTNLNKLFGFLLKKYGQEFQDFCDEATDPVIDQALEGSQTRGKGLLETVERNLMLLGIKEISTEVEGMTGATVDEIANEVMKRRGL